MARMQWLTGIALALSVVAPTQAQLYKWVDEQGQTHFSDQPPHNSKTQVEAQTLPSVDNRIAQPDQIDFYKAPKKKARKRKTKRRNCTKYLTRLDKVQQQLRRGYKEPKGNKLRARRRELSEQLQQCKKGY